MKEDLKFIVDKLLHAQNEFISGETLSSSLNISRVSIYEKIKQLSKQGFDIEAIKNRGYRLRTPPPQLCSLALDFYLKQLPQKCTFFVYESIDSTNSEADRLLTNNQTAPFAVLANTQGKGRGRLGRQWISSDSANIYISFGFRPNLPPLQMQLFTIWMGINFCQLLNEKWNLSLKIKWPNDLLFNGKKLGGILTEAQIDADLTRKLILGFGLNVNAKKDNWPPEVANIATSLSEIKNDIFNINLLAAEIINKGLQAYQHYCQNNYQEELQALWNQLDFLKGKEITGIKNREQVTGIASGITPSGQLIIKTHSNKQILLDSGETTLKNNVLL